VVEALANEVAAVFSKASLMIYCYFYRRFPSVKVFFVDHRNDIVVNIFGLVMSIVGDHFIWYLDPIGAICIALLILFSWAANAFEQVWLLAGKGAPRTYVSRLIYVALTHSPHILKVDTVSARFQIANLYLSHVRVLTDRGQIVSVARTMRARGTLSRSTSSWTPRRHSRYLMMLVRRSSASWKDWPTWKGRLSTSTMTLNIMFMRSTGRFTGHSRQKT